jgi:Flp pilus assembly protein CpaB
MADTPADKGFGRRRSLKDMTSTKEGSMTLAIGAAIIAGLLILVFVKAYKDNVNGDNASESVFVARALIPKGSSASIIASQQLLQRTSLKGKDVKSGAIKDPSSIAGQVAAEDIAPGQQITASSFRSGGEGVASELAGTDRAIAVPVDATHSVNGEVHAGDHVDVLVGLAGTGAGVGQPTLRTVLQNVTVLSGVNSSGGGVGNDGSGGGNVILRVTDKQATLLAFASDNGRIWLTLRPPSGAKQNAPSVATTGLLVAATQQGGK